MSLPCCRPAALTVVFSASALWCSLRPSCLFVDGPFDDWRHGLNADCVAASPASPTSLSFFWGVDKCSHPELNLETPKRK